MAAEVGLLQFSWEDGVTKTLSKKDYENIHLKDGKITGADGTLWVINAVDNEQYIISDVKNFDICGLYVWSSYGSEAILLNTLTAQTWKYDSEDGIPGNKIYSVHCDEEWVWFLTDKGVAFYNWRKYHKNN